MLDLGVRRRQLSEEAGTGMVGTVKGSLRQLVRVCRRAVSNTHVNTLPPARDSPTGSLTYTGPDEAE